MKNQRGKVCIPSIDSGGMRGILSGKAEAYLEHALKLKSGNPDARIADYFDVSAGSGIGGISLPLFIHLPTCYLFSLKLIKYKLMTWPQLLFLPLHSPSYIHTPLNLIKFKKQYINALKMKLKFVKKHGQLAARNVKLVFGWFILNA
jgi:patatin-like phospholipase/acyl hydrolase